MFKKDENTLTQFRKDSPDRFLKIVGANESSIRATDLQHSRYQHGELQGLIDAYKAGHPVEPVEIFLDEFKNVIGAEGRHRALAAQKAGVQEFQIVLRQRVREIMKTGASEAASSTMSNVSKIIRGARRMPKI